MTLSSYSFHVPTHIIVQQGGRHRLREHAGSLGTNPFIVAGDHGARDNGLLETTGAQWATHAVYAGVPADPDLDVVDDAAKRCRREHCDFVVALGGGSVIDVAKAVAGLALNPGNVRHYIGREPFSRGALPIVAVPTTAGSGSEVTPSAVLVDREGPQKRTLKGGELFPRLALLDVEVTTTLPPSVTRDTGLDALSQGIEGFLSARATPISDAIARQVVAEVRTFLPQVLARPGDLEARAALHRAALLSGMVIAQSGTTLVHGMGYQYTLHAGVPHGRANALLLTPVLQQEARHQPARVAELATLLGQPCAPEPEAAAEAICLALHALLREVDLSPAAADAGVDAGQLAAFAAAIAADPYRQKNQVQALEEAHLLNLYQKSHAGDCG